MRTHLAVLLHAMLLALASVAQAQTESVLYSFANNGTDGFHPYSGLARDRKGNLYGMTYDGGVNGYGTVFKVTPSGTETILHSFAGGTTDGCSPYFNGVVLDKAGNLYGTTFLCGANGGGTVFKITSSGTENILYSFAVDGTDGFYPNAGVVLDKTGNIYGTTRVGGADNYGTVFKVTPSGTETILHSFAGGTTDGCTPYFGGGVALGRKNVLYGTTVDCGTNGYGTVYKVTQSGIETVLHSFAANGTDGYNPYVGVVLDKTGNIYGATPQGGTNGYGVVFKLTTSGTETVLHSFANNGTDGYTPYAGVILDKLGNLYGTTTAGGAFGGGTVFEITSSGTESVLYSFASFGTDGSDPQAALVLGKKNTLYGTTIYGGDLSCDSPWGCGTVFKLSQGLDPFVGARAHVAKNGNPI